MQTSRSASSRGQIAPFYVMEVMRAAEERERAGGHVLHLEVGQPSTPAPR
ncbi:MAG: pyridoxal phosphate-dependent aminotransferase, partial [Actinomycetota bacterium]